MPREETFLKSRIENGTVAVIKTYDQSFAQEAFAHMDETALAHLAKSLAFPDTFEDEDIPSASDENYQDFVWEAMVDSAREDGNVFSYFVVKRTSGGSSEDVFVSGDWPTAEAYVKLVGALE
jgi:hypothetical protein